MASDSQQTILAVDLGASSGRLVAGKITNDRLALQDVHRFGNGGVRIGNHLQWNLLSLWQSIKDGIRKAGSSFGDSIDSIGVDTWGVDFALLGRGDEILGNPYHYRDEQNNGKVEEAFEIVSREDIFDTTGLQFMQINTLYQLLALKQANSPLLEAAETFLMIPDLFHWLLTGVKANEQTIASTSQFYDPREKNWSTTLLDRFKIPTAMLQDIVAPGAELGGLTSDLRSETGVGEMKVIVPGTHDTASAVMAVPADSKPGIVDWCYISSGTWSLMGVEIPEPLINERASELNFTNEAGVANTTRLLKNIGGLWLVQECRRIWSRDGSEVDFAGLVEQAAASKPLASLINPDHEAFIAPAEMPNAIADFCQQSGQPVPETQGAVIRCALESLALRYRQVLCWLEELVGNKLDTIYIVGGGTQNKLLCQMAADACNRRVVAGPVEATAIGNIMMQAVSLGVVDSIQQAREFVKRSFDVEEFLPRETAPWDEAFARFEAL